MIYRHSLFLFAKMCVRPYAPPRTTLWEQLEGKSIRRLEVRRGGGGGTAESAYCAPYAFLASMTPSRINEEEGEEEKKGALINRSDNSIACMGKCSEPRSKQGQNYLNFTCSVV